MINQTHLLKNEKPQPKTTVKSKKPTTTFTRT